MEWQPIETAPKMRTVLLFAETDIGEDGIAKNWRMGTGFWQEGYGVWRWEGRILKEYEIKPTHWMPLPAPPMNAEHHGGENASE